MKQCPTCRAPVDGDDDHYLYRPPAPLDLEAIQLGVVERLRREVLARVRLRPGRGFIRIFEEACATERRHLYDDERVSR